MFTAAALSPPPIIVVASVSASAFATAMVPFASTGFSNTPIGPFHTTVFADLTALAKSSCVLGPMSSPSISEGILSIETVSTGRFLSSIGSGNAFAQTASTGRRISHPFSLAFSNIFLQYSSFSSSTSDFPISYPFALMKVKAMPPPMIKVSHFSRRLSMTASLSETFAPPSIATKGRTGFSTACPRKRISFCIR